MYINHIFYNTFSNRGFFDMNSGSRPYCTFLIIAKGSFKVKFSNDEKEHIIKENEIAFFPPNTHFRRGIVDPITFHQIGFSMDLSLPHFQYLSQGKLNIPHDHVKKIIETLAFIPYLSSTDSLTNHIAEHILWENYVYCLSKKPLSKYPDDITTIVKYIGEHLSEKIDIDELADMVHLSHVGLLWKFKQYLHTTPSKYIKMMRMLYAKQLVAEGDLPISEIAALCGYNNPYYFSNSFHDWFKCTPTEMRKRYSKKWITPTSGKG